MAYFAEHSGEEIAIGMVGLGGAVLGFAALCTAGKANSRCTKLEGRVDTLESKTTNLEKGLEDVKRGQSDLSDIVDILCGAD
jgi:hypothetical protein